jgi:hypothetical protein
LTAQGVVTGLISALAVGGWFLLPGAPWAAWWSRRQGLDPLEALGLTAALGLAIGSVVTIALLAAGRLSAGAILLIVGAEFALGSAALVVAEVKRGLRSAAFGRRTVLSSVIPADLARGVTAGMVALGILASLAAQAASALPDGLPRASTSWYYALLSLRAGASGSLPQTLPEWGLERPFKADYLTFTAHLAGAELLDPTGLPTLETYRILVLLVAALLLLVFLRRWSLLAALLGLGLFVSGNLWLTKFDSLRPESYGVATVAGALWAVSTAWQRQGSDRVAWLGLAGVLGALTALGHLEIFVVGGALGFALLVVAERPRWPVRLATATAVALIAIVGFGGTLLLFGRGVPGSGELAASNVGGDQTWAVFNSLVESADRPLPALPTDPAYLAASARFPWPALDLLSPLGLLIPILAGLAIYAVARGPADPRTRRLLVFGFVVVGLLVVASIAIFVFFPTYIPRRIGVRRFLPYAALGVSAVFAAGGATAVTGLLLSRRSGLRNIRWAPVLAGTLCLVFAIGVMGAGSLRTFRDRGPRAADVLAGRDAYRWIAGNTPSQARVLVSGYTDGVVAALAQRPGVIDGRAPYGEDKAWIDQATRDSRLARRFFAAPSVTLLEALDPDYIVMGPDRALATAVAYRADEEAIDSLPGLQLVETFGPVRIYRVTS